LFVDILKILDVKTNGKVAKLLMMKFAYTSIILRHNVKNLLALFTIQKHFKYSIDIKYSFKNL
jgi:hypothetical protein